MVEMYQTCSLQKDASAYFDVHHCLESRANLAGSINVLRQQLHHLLDLDIRKEGGGMKKAKGVGLSSGRGKDETVREVSVKAKKS